MPHPAPGPAARGHSQPGFRVFTMADLDQLTARAGLPPVRRLKIQAAAAVTGFRVTSRRARPGDERRRRLAHRA